jgi:hypothetical protein
LLDNDAQLSGSYHQFVDFRIAIADRFPPFDSPNTKALAPAISASEDYNSAPCRISSICNQYERIACAHRLNAFNSV